MLSSEKKEPPKPDEAPHAPSGFKSYVRIFQYADRISVNLYYVAFSTAIAAGAALPFMDLLFGKFVTTFNKFAIGAVSANEYMNQVSYYA